MGYNQYFTSLAVLSWPLLLLTPSEYWEREREREREIERTCNRCGEYVLAREREWEREREKEHPGEGGDEGKEKKARRKEFYLLFQGYSGCPFNPNNLQLPTPIVIHL